MVRFLHAVPGAPAVNFALDDANIFEDVEYETLTGFESVDAGVYTPRVLAGGSTVIAADPVELERGKMYSFVVYGATSLSLNVYEEDTVGNPDTAKVRALHVAENVAMVDVVRALSTQFDDLETDSVRSYQATAPDTYVYSLRKGDENNVNFDFVSIRLRVCTIYSIFVVGDETQDDSLAPRFVVGAHDAAVCQSNNNGPRVRWLNLAPGSGPLNGIVDGTVAVTGIGLRQVSDYVTQSAGTHVAGFRDQTTAANELTDSVTWANGRWYTVAIYGNNGEGLAFVEDSRVVGPAARIRVIHLGPTLGVVDLYLDGQLFADNVAFKDSRDYTGGPTGEFAAEVRDQSGNTLSRFTGINTAPQATFTVYLLGEPGTTGVTSVASPFTIDAETLGANFAYIRVIHVIPGNAVVVASFSDGQNSSALTYLDASNYFRFSPGKIKVDVRTQSGAEIDTITVDATGGTYHTVWVNRPSDPQLSVTQDDFAGGQKVRAINWVEGTCYDFRFSRTAINDICFDESSVYAPFSPAGQITSQILDSTTGRTVSTDNQVLTVVPVVYTVVAVGTRDNAVVGLVIDADSERFFTIQTTTTTTTGSSGGSSGASRGATTGSTGATASSAASRAAA